MWKSSASGGFAAGCVATATATAAVVLGRRFLASAAHSTAALDRMAPVLRRRPALVGDSLQDVETPCLLVDLDAMEKNLRALPRSLERVASHAVAIRPHAKAHKCAEIAHLQLRHSQAVGLCCQKVCEAEALFAGGVHNLLLSNELEGESRYQRMARLAQQGASITLLFDHARGVAQAAQAARHYNIRFDALVDVNVGQHRCGVDSVADALALADCIQKQREVLVLRGIQAYHGSAQHIRSFQEKQRVIQDEVATTARAVRDAFQSRGFCCDVVTGGGTGTYMMEAASGVFTEVQPGSYLFNDADYARNGASDDQVVGERDWQQSLFVLTTVMSVNAGGGKEQRPPRAVVDAGMKAVSLDSGPPVVHASLVPGAAPVNGRLVYASGGDEHGILTPMEEEMVKNKKKVEMPELGHKLLLTPGHCDPTTNLYDFIVGFRGDRVENVWTLGGRGPGN